MLLMVERMIRAWFCLLACTALLVVPVTFIADEVCHCCEEHNDSDTDADSPFLLFVERSNPGSDGRCPPGDGCCATQCGSCRCGSFGAFVWTLPQNGLALSLASSLRFLPGADPLRNGWERAVFHPPKA